MIGALTKQLTRRRLSWATIIAVGVTGLFILTFPLLFTRPFPQHVMILIFLFATLGQAWNLVGGYAGQVSFGHAVFFGMGAYTSTVLLLRWNVNPWLGMLVGAVVAAFVSIIIGYPCFRLKGRYFAIATMATGEIVRLMFVNWEWVGGARGLFVPMLDESLLNLQFHTTKVPYYYIALVMLVVSVLVTRRVERTRPGYYFMAIKEDTDAARSLGVDATRYKLLAIIISAIFSAVGGTLYAQYVLYIDPDSVLLLHLSTRICLVSVLGGTGTLWGPIIGAFILIPMAEFTRVYLGGGGGGIHLVVYGALIMLVAVIEPGGLMALVKRLRRRGAQSAASEKGILSTPA
jgi:branched-chain amino acid transport system permease protein